MGVAWELRVEMAEIETKDPQFSLRSATPADAAIVLHFMRKLGTYQQMADEITATEADIFNLLADGHGEALFGMLNEEPIGMVFFSRTCSAFTGRSGLFLDAFVLDAAARQRGYGQIMMAELAKTALERGGLMLEWGCLDWNTAAIKFYEKMGAYCLNTMQIYRLSPSDMQTISKRF